MPLEPVAGPGPEQAQAQGQGQEFDPVALVKDATTLVSTVTEAFLQSDQAPPEAKEALAQGASLWIGAIGEITGQGPAQGEEQAPAGPQPVEQIPGATPVGPQGF